MNFHLIYWIFGILTAYVAVISLLKNTLNEYVTNELNSLFLNIESYKNGITEKIFKGWVTKYEDINIVKKQYMNFGRVTIYLVVALFITFLLDCVNLDESVIYLEIFYTIDIFLGAIFGVLFFSLLSWWNKQKK